MDAVMLMLTKEAKASLSTEKVGNFNTELASKTICLTGQQKS